MPCEAWEDVEGWASLVELMCKKFLDHTHFPLKPHPLYVLYCRVEAIMDSRGACV